MQFALIKLKIILTRKLAPSYSSIPMVYYCNWGQPKGVQAALVRGVTPTERQDLVGYWETAIAADRL